MTSMTGNSPSGEMKSLPVRGWFTEDGDDMSISSDISMLIYIYILIPRKSWDKVNPRRLGETGSTYDAGGSRLVTLDHGLFFPVLGLFVQHFCAPS